MRDTVRNYSIGTFSWGSPILSDVRCLPYSSNRHVTPVSVRGRKGLTCSIRAPSRPRFDALRQSVSSPIIFGCVSNQNLRARERGKRNTREYAGIVGRA